MTKLSMEYPESKANLVAVATTLTDDELRQIFAMEQDLFPESLQDNHYEKERKEGEFAVVAYCPEGLVAGYLFAVPHHVAREKLKEEDPLMHEATNALYVESIAVRSDMQGSGYFSKLMKKFLEETEGKTVTMHARVKTASSVGMKKYGAVYLHSVDNWFDSGEKFEYLIIQR